MTYLVRVPWGRNLGTSQLDAWAVVAEGSNLAAVVTQALEMGYAEGTIDNQDGGTADLAEWVAQNQTRLAAYRLEMEESYE
jgi:hypothetical protein